MSDKLTLIEVAQQPAPTRARILDAALELFAERGYAGTSIAELERAAGLSPGSGALYRHFSSKRQLLDEALGERMAAIETVRSQLAFGPLGDLRSELTAIGRWGLAELERERLLARIVMREGPNLPEVVEGFRRAIVETAHAMAVEVLGRYSAERDAQLADLAASAEVICSSLVGFALQGQIVGRDFVDIDDERFIAAWAETALAVVEQNERS